MIVAATFAPALSTNCTASSVVACSNTTFNSGSSRSSGASTRSMNTASRSNTSTAGSVTSPCTHRTMPMACIRSSTTRILAMSVTPLAELVVAPAG